MESKKQDMKKDGVDFLIKQGYKKLSAKTFISDVDLEHFLNKDFTNINKTRALGFIQILEREYDVDLSDLRAAYLDHESTNRPKEPETLFVEKPIKDEKDWQKYIPYITGAIAVLGLLFYLFRPNNDLTQDVEPIAKQVEENKSAIKEAEKNLEKLQKSESKKQESSMLENSLNESNNSESDIEGDDLDLDKVVLQMIKERNITASEHNITLDDLDANSSIKQEDTNKTESKNIEKEKLVKQKSVKKEIPLAKTIPIKKEKKKKSSVGDLYIKPLQKAWVGVIYLDNFTKKDFLIRGKLPLDANRDQLIVVGHNQFKIYNKTYSVKFRGKGPVRFIYKNGDLMEISKKEFIKTSAGVGW